MRNNHEGGRLADMVLVSGNKLGMVRQTLAADNTPFDSDIPQLISLDPDGAKDILLPPVAGNAGLFFFIANWAGGAEAITVKDSADSVTVGSVAQGKLGIFVCDGVAWFGAVQGT